MIPARRMTDRITHYWERLRKEEALPPANKFNPAAIEDIWTYCVLCKLEPGVGEQSLYVVERAGDKITALMEENLLGARLNPLQKHAKAAVLVQLADAACASLKPEYGEGQFINARHKVVKYRSCCLPLGTREVSHVVTVMGWREF